MKYVFIAICAIFIVLELNATPKKTFLKLVEVNKCWNQQDEVLSLPSYTTKSEADWIQIHLKLVEKNLRAKATPHLSAQQLQNRSTALNHLNHYWKQKAFPVNDLYNHRLPIFIDRHDNFCAVGYLLKATGYESLARKISLESNLAYVQEMNFPELFQWANNFGFAVGELAWIQPVYPPQSTFNKVGNGVSGNVNDIAVDEADNAFYVAGAFTYADSTVLVNNVAKVSEQNGLYTWHSLGTGTNGRVSAVEVFDGKIFIGGDFTKAGNKNVTHCAYWDGAQWIDASVGITGQIKSLEVFNGELFAGGFCNTCAGISNRSYVYKWNGSSWDIQGAVSGVINKLRSLNGNLYVVGKFKVDGLSACNRNIMKWTTDSLVRVGVNCIDNEVFDIALHRDTLLVGCKFYDDGKISGVEFFDGTEWRQFMGPSQFITEGIDGVSVRAITSRNGVLVLGGNLYNNVIVGTSAVNFIAFDPMAGDENLGNFDLPVNCFAFYKNKLLIGGDFVTHNYGVRLNGIAIKDNLPNLINPNLITASNSIKANIHPNPIQSGNTLEIIVSEELQSVFIVDLMGRIVRSESQCKIVLSDFKSGIYIVTGKTISGNSFTSQIAVY